MPTAAAHDGIGLHYDLHDFTDPWTSKPTVLLQHGFGRNGAMWFGCIPYLARHYRLICPDLRGCGRGDKGFDAATGINAANYLADLCSILDHAGVDQVHYVGESIGGTLGYVFAAEHPGRVRTLSVMASPTHINPWMREAYAAGHPSWPQAIETLGSAGWAAATNTAARFPAEMGAGFHEWYAGQIGATPTPVLAAMARFALGVNAEPLLPRIAAPVLALFPAAGRIATTEQEATLQRLVPDVRTMRMATPYHMVQFMQPAACAEQVLAFLLREDGLAP